MWQKIVENADPSEWYESNNALYVDTTFGQDYWKTTIIGDTQEGGLLISVSKPVMIKNFVIGSLHGGSNVISVYKYFENSNINYELYYKKTLSVVQGDNKISPNLFLNPGRYCFLLEGDPFLYSDDSYGISNTHHFFQIPTAFLKKNVPNYTKNKLIKAYVGIYNIQCFILKSDLYLGCQPKILNDADLVKESYYFVNDGKQYSVFFDGSKQWTVP